MREPKIYARIMANFLLTLLGVLSVIFLLPKLLRFFLPFVIAFFISSIANPFVRFMEKKIKILRKHSTVMIIVSVLGAVVGMLYLLLSFLIKQIFAVYEDRFNIYNEIKEILDNFTDRLGGLYDLFPMELQQGISNIQDTVTVWIENFLADIELPDISTVGSYVGSFVDVLFITIITILAAYFLTAERDNIADTLIRILPDSILKYYSMIVDSFKKAIGGYFKAQFKIMIILMAILFVGFEFAGVSYSLLLAFLIAFLDFLPVFGTGTVLWPWLVVDVIVGDYKQAVFLGILYLVCQLVKQILQPKMVGDTLGMNPLVALFYMFIGYRLGGIFGMIIGIPIGMLLVSFYQAGVFDQLIRGVKIIAHDINEFRKY